MKKFLMFLCAVMLVFGMVGSASALSFLDVNGDHSGPVWMDENTNSSETWLFDLDNDILAIGDVNVGDIINSADLYVDILDEGDLSGVPGTLEFADLDLDGTNIYTNVEVNTGTFTLDVMTWIADHQLNVSISNVQNIDLFMPGNFLVDEIRLAGDYTDAAPVPEPTTILLLGSGLLGLVGYNRKRFSKKS